MEIGFCYDFTDLLTEMVVGKSMDESIKYVTHFFGIKSSWITYIVDAICTWFVEIIELIPLIDFKCYANSANKFYECSNIVIQFIELEGWIAD